MYARQVSMEFHARIRAVLMKTPYQTTSRRPMSVDAPQATGQTPRRKTLHLPKSVPAIARHLPRTPETKSRLGSADQLAMQQAEDEGMYLRAK